MLRRPLKSHRGFSDRHVSFSQQPLARLPVANVEVLRDYCQRSAQAYRCLMALLDIVSRGNYVGENLDELSFPIELFQYPLLLTDAQRRRLAAFDLEQIDLPREVKQALLKIQQQAIDPAFCLDNELPDAIFTEEGLGEINHSLNRFAHLSLLQDVLDQANDQGVIGLETLTPSYVERLRQAGWFSEERVKPLFEGLLAKLAEDFTLFSLPALGRLKAAIETLCPNLKPQLQQLLGPQRASWYVDSFVTKAKDLLAQPEKVGDFFKLWKSFSIGSEPFRHQLALVREEGSDEVKEKLVAFTNQLIGLFEASAPSFL